MNLKKLVKRLAHVTMVTCVIGLLCSTAVTAQGSPYQAIRLNDGEAIVYPDMFSVSEEGENINGPSLIRIPDWIAEDDRADPTAQYYLYFGHHIGDYIRMAWAANIEGPYTLYNDSGEVGSRGVLDNDEENIYLDNDIYIEENHLSSPDVVVDHDNEQIIMYFHSGSSYFVDGDEQNDQVTWVSTSPYGLDFYDGIKSVQLGSSYFRVFVHGGNLYAYDNGAKLNKALDAENPWAIPSGHDFTEQLWDRADENPFQTDLSDDGYSTSLLRVRHTGVRANGDELHVFYSRRGEWQERIQFSTITMNADWENWDSTYPPTEVLTPNPGWEGGERTLALSETSNGVDLNQLRDPDFFEDADGQMYVVYTGNGEGGLGIAKLYNTPEPTQTLITTRDLYTREGYTGDYEGLNNLTISNGSSSSDKRIAYLQFDLTEVSDVEHAVVRLYFNSSTSETRTNANDIEVEVGGPITVYETSGNLDADIVTYDNAPDLEDVITTSYITGADQYYDWNITAYAKEHVGSVFNLALAIAPTNEASHKFGTIAGGNPAELLLVSDATLSNETVSEKSTASALKAYPNPFADKLTVKVPSYDGQSIVEVELIRLLDGAVVSKNTYKQSEIEISNISLATGVYFLRVSYNNGKTLIKKVVKFDR